MAIEIENYDAAEYLSGGPQIRAYAEAALEDGDPALMEDSIDVIARAIGMTAIAEAMGRPRDSLCRAFKGDVPKPGQPTVRDILLALACGRPPAGASDIDRTDTGAST